MGQFSDNDRNYPMPGIVPQNLSPDLMAAGLYGSTIVISGSLAGKWGLLKVIEAGTVSLESAAGGPMPAIAGTITALALPVNAEVRGWITKVTVSSGKYQLFNYGPQQ